MKRLAGSLAAMLIVFCGSVAAQVASEHERFLLVERELAIETDGSPGIVAAEHLLKFDTATGQTWRYERRNWNDPTKRSSWFVPIPLEGSTGDGKEAGRFRLVARPGGKATQPFPDVLIIDGTTGMVWVYRGLRQVRGGANILQERFALIKDGDPQK